MGLNQMMTKTELEKILDKAKTGEYLYEIERPIMEAHFKQKILSWGELSPQSKEMIRESQKVFIENRQKYIDLSTKLISGK